MISQLWADTQTNKPLLHHRDVDNALRHLERYALPLHPDMNKNWDNMIAIDHTYNRCSFHEPILDAGAGDESAYLPGLNKLGFTNLVGINLDRNDDYKAGVKDGIRYGYGDITSTPFPSGIFGFVSCLSVIEHGVDWRAFFTEMSRILKPDAQLFVSFDYWHDKVNTDGLVTHGAPIHIFSPDDLHKILEFTHTVGLTLLGDGIYQWCEEAIIQWSGIEYTFMNLLFRKEI